MSEQERQVPLRMEPFNGLFSRHAAWALNRMLFRYICSSLEVKIFQTFLPFIHLIFQGLGPRLLSSVMRSCSHLLMVLTTAASQGTASDALVPSERVGG